MNRKLVNGLLLLSVATGGVGTFTSCKDTEEDFRNQVLVGQADLSDQIAALRNLTDPTFKTNLDNLIDGLIAAGDFATNTDLQNAVNDLVALRSRVTSLETLVNGINNQLGNFATKDELSTELTNLKNTLTTMLQTEVNSLNQAITALGGRLDTVESTLSTLQGDVTTLRTDLTTLQSQVSTMEGKLTTIESNLQTLTQAVADAQRDATQALADAAANLSLINTLRSDLTTLEGKLGNYYTKTEVDGFISTLTTKCDDLQTALNNLDTELSGKITNLTTDLTNYKLEVNGKFDSLETAMTAVEDDITTIKEFNTKVRNQLSWIWEKLAHLITSIQLQRVVNPIFGGLDFPVGFSTAVLANYLYNGVSDVTFPNDDSNLEYGQTDYAKNLYENLSLDLAAIGAPSELIKGNTMMLGSLGDVYVTLNPTANDFTGVRAKLVNSLDQPILDDLVLEKDNNTLFKFGYTRAEDKKNGLHRAAVKATNVEKAVSQIGLEVEPGLLEAFKDAIKDRTRQDFAELAKLLVKQFNNKFDAYALKVSWDDVDKEGKKFENSVISGYDIAATTFRPLSYRSGWGFTVDRKLPEFSPLTEYFDNFFDDLAKKIHINLGLTGVTNPFGDDFELDLSGAKFEITEESASKMVIEIDLRGLEVWGDDPENPGNQIVIGTLEGDAALIKLTYDPNAGTIVTDNQYAGALNGLIDVLVDEINNFINGEGDNSLTAQINAAVKEQITDKVGQMIDDINAQLTGIQGNLDSQIKDILDDIKGELSGKLSHFNRFVDLYNKIARKVNKVLEDPNAYLQVMAFYNNASGPHHLSTTLGAPTVFNAAGGSGIELFMTTYNAELIVPSYKKYVAISGVYKDGVKQNVDLRELNEKNGNLNVVSPGNQHRFGIDASKLEAGFTYEVLYQALDYRGYTSTRTYYITVKK